LRFRPKCAAAEPEGDAGSGAGAGEGSGAAPRGASAPTNTGAGAAVAARDGLAAAWRHSAPTSERDCEESSPPRAARANES
jgi:hypothetical protein